MRVYLIRWISLAAVVAVFAVAPASALAGTSDGRSPDTRDAAQAHTTLVTESGHPFMRHWWPQGHIIGWEHTFVHLIHHLLNAIVHDQAVEPYGATFEDGYKNAVICDAVLVSARDGRRVAITY